MLKDISLKDIKDFQKRYNENVENKEIESKILKLGLREACLDNKKEYEFKFNIEVPKIKMYNQYESHQCNIYASLRMIKDILRKTSELDVDSLDISANYIAFFDKLEKVNSLYDELIENNNISIEFINSKVERYIGSYGTFYFCKKIIDKYGLVKTEDMEDVNETYDENLTIELLKNKIKVDSLILIGVTDIEEKKKIKKDLLYEAYCFLSKIYGNPPTTINIEGELLTPTEFKDKYLKNYLNDYITVTTLSKEALFESYSFIPSVYLEDKEKIIKLSKEEFKSAIVSQLKDEISVWFSAELSTAFDSKNQILDYNAYKFNEYLNIKEVNKNEKMRLDIIDYDHAMCITGVLIENNEIIQYKVDNSYGKYGKFKGNLIMTSSFLDNCVITAVINKKYITKKDKDM